MEEDRVIALDELAEVLLTKPPLAERRPLLLQELARYPGALAGGDLGALPGRAAVGPGVMEVAEFSEGRGHEEPGWPVQIVNRAA